MQIKALFIMLVQLNGRMIFQELTQLKHNVT